jgi:hypothetical protein
MTEERTPGAAGIRVGEREASPPGTVSRGVRATDLKVVKRRVRVRVYLSDGVVREGELYSELHREDGTPASLVDRLNDPREVQLPLAYDGKHLLVSKAAILAVTLDSKLVPRPTVEGTREFALKVFLTNRKTVEGVASAVLSPVHSRALDFLNGTPYGFLTLFSPGRATLVNRDHVVAVLEAQAPNEVPNPDPAA